MCILVCRVLKKETYSVCLPGFLFNYRMVYVYSGGPVCLIVEYARYGNLRDFLRQCEEVVLSLNHKPHVPRHRCFNNECVNTLVVRKTS